MKRAFTEEDFVNMGKLAAAEVVDTAATIVKDLSDSDFVAKFAAGEVSYHGDQALGTHVKRVIKSNGDVDFQNRVEDLRGRLEFLLAMLGHGGVTRWCPHCLHPAGSAAP
jgi:hypothetical protein